MITSIILKGFKSFIDDEFELGQLTLLTGLNSSGKSSVIQAIQLLEKAQSNKPVYLQGHGALSESQNPYVEEGLTITGIIDYNSQIVVNSSGSFDANAFVDFPNVIHIAADRFGPEASIYADPENVSIGKRGENIFRVIKAYEEISIPDIVKHPLSEGDTFLYNLRAWLSIVSPNTKFESFVVEQSDSSYGIFDGHRAKNVGFGLSYSLPIITALLMGVIDPSKNIVVLENPEAHLHPRGQTAMADLICRCTQAGLQVVVETHSDHLFDGIRLFTKNSYDQFFNHLRAYWFELDENRNTDVMPVSIDRHGRISNWPEGMFDQFSINASNLLS